MQAIFDFFNSIGEFFNNVWDVIKYIFEQITEFFKMLKPGVDFFISLLSSLPPLFLGFGITMIIVLILYVVLGRTAGGD